MLLVVAIIFLLMVGSHACALTVNQGDNHEFIDSVLALCYANLEHFYTVDGCTEYWIVSVVNEGNLDLSLFYFSLSVLSFCLRNSFTMI